MAWQKEVVLPPFKRGFHLITNEITKHLPQLPAAGLFHVFIKHTSVGITLNENADPTVLHDFERFMDKLVPDGNSDFIHTDEGPDDMPAHIKSSLLGNSITLPITNGRLNLGTWQGIYLCEFRNYGGNRKLVLTVI